MQGLNVGSERGAAQPTHDARARPRRWLVRCGPRPSGRAIARSTAEAHGGQLTAGAAAEGGALFRLTLPVPAQEDAA